MFELVYTTYLELASVLVQARVWSIVGLAVLKHQV